MKTIMFRNISTLLCIIVQANVYNRDKLNPTERSGKNITYLFFVIVVSVIAVIFILLCEKKV